MSYPVREFDNAFTPEATWWNWAVSEASIRAAKEDPEAAVAGMNMLSVENCEMGEGDVFAWISDPTNLVRFLQALRHLPLLDQEILLSYYVVARPQHVLAKICRSTQTLLSTKIRECLKRLGAVLLLGDITKQLLAEVFSGAGVEHLLATPLSTIAWSYSKTRAYWLTAEKLKVKRQDIRRALLKAHKTLVASTDMREQALGAWLWGSLEKSNPMGNGLAKREMRKQGHQVLKDGAILGQFSVDITDPEYAKFMFISRAER